MTFACAGDYLLLFVFVLIGAVWGIYAFVEDRSRQRRLDREYEVKMAMFEAEWWWSHGRPRPHGGKWGVFE